MELTIEKLLSSATNEERSTLAHILQAQDDSAESLRSCLFQSSSTLFQKIRRKKLNYYQVLRKTAAAWGVRVHYGDTVRDVERRLSRLVIHELMDCARATNGDEDRHHVTRSLAATREERHYGGKIVAMGSLSAARFAGNGIYEVAGKILTFLSTAGQIKVSAAAFAAVSDVISVAIGPVGWLTVGLGCAHTYTKPNYCRLAAAITSIHLIRNRVDPRWEWRGYTPNEWMRKSLVYVIPIALIAFVITKNMTQQ